MTHRNLTAGVPPDSILINSNPGLTALEAALAQIAELRSERDAIQAVLMHAGIALHVAKREAAETEAENARLREALRKIEGRDSWIDASIRSSGPEREVRRGECGEIAHAALAPFKDGK